MKNLSTLLIVFLISCGQQKNDYKNLNEFANELGAQCPKMVDEGTRFDKVKVSGDNLELTFTLVKMDKNLTDTDGLSKGLKELLINNWKKGYNMSETNLGLLFIKQNDIVFHYIYLDKNKKVLSDIIIKPKEYIK